MTVVLAVGRTCGSLSLTMFSFVCAMHVLYPDLSVIALYFENADVFGHEDCEQSTNLKSSVLLTEGGGIHASSVPSLNSLLAFDLYV